MKLPSSIDYRLLSLLLAIDVCFVLVSVGERLGLLPTDPLLRITEDRGYSEWFQYTKELGIFLLLAIAGARRRSRLLIVLSLLYVYLLLDDMLQIHEQVGDLIASWGVLQPYSRLRPAKDLGQLLWSAAVGSAFLVPIGLAYLRSDGDTRRIARWVLALTGVIAVFGVVIDFLAVGVFGNSLMEEPGEMFVMSVALAFVFAVVPPRQKALEPAAR